MEMAFKHSFWYSKNCNLSNLLILLLLLIWQSLGVSASASYDCTTARLAAEKAICGHFGLGNSDQKMAELYSKLISRLSSDEKLQLRNAQRVWIRQRNRCRSDTDCISRHYESRIIELQNHEIVLLQREKEKHEVRVNDCAIEIARGQDIATLLSVRLTSTTNLKAKEKMSLSWALDIDSTPRIPTFLVIDTPAEVRFDGQYFLPLTDGTAGPHSISFMKNRVRVFIPLHHGNPTEQRSFSIIPLRAGNVEIGWTVVTGGNCGEHNLTERKTEKVNVLLGKPTLVVQDRFSQEKPQRQIRDNSNLYDLLIFDERYKVLSATTGEKIVENVGVSPNFSPTGRFVVSQNPTSQDMEIVDLVSGQVEHTTFQGLIGWARNDSLVIYSGSILGRIAIFPSLGGEAGYFDLGGGGPRQK